MSHAQLQPIPDGFEHFLQLTSLTVTFLNLSIGVLLKMPEHDSNRKTVISQADDKKDSLGLTVILVFINSIVILALICKLHYLFFKRVNLFNTHTVFTPKLTLS